MFGAESHDSGPMFAAVHLKTPRPRDLCDLESRQALGCSIPSAARTLLRAGGILNHVVPIGQGV